MKATIHHFLLSAIALFFIVPISANAQSNLSDEVKELKQMVKQLQQRIEELETAQKKESAPLPSSKPAAASPETKKSGASIQATWNKGLEFQTQDGSTRIKLGGRVQSDWYTGNIEDNDFPDGTRFRRVWLRLNGKIYDDTIFDWQYDFSDNGQAKLKDLYIGYTGLDWATIRVGQFREPFGLEQLTNSSHITLMERAPLDLLTPSRQTGVMLDDEILGKRMTWALGAFKNSNAFGNGFENDDVNGDWAVTGRLTGLPWFEDGGKRLLHLGASYSHRDWGGDPFRIQARGSFCRGNILVDTGTDNAAYNVDQFELFGAEAALVLGPLSLQSEYVLNDLQSSGFGDQTYDGAYAQISYFLTGEYRPYQAGRFVTPSPKRNFGKDGGWGAWELAFRYGWLDLDDTPVTAAKGGELNDYAFGVNWYMNPNFRMIWNYVHSESSGANPDDLAADIFQMRFDLCF
ncbi:MAG: porin [Candidatus Omnitrophota bacterium]